MRAAFWTPARSSALAIAATFIASSVVGGCFIFTGSTDDYQLVDSGQPETSATATCSADAECISESCVSASDCDAGEICCLTATLSSFGSVCQAGPCAEAQICTSNAECGDGGKACTLQQCSSKGVSLSLQTCGAIPGCH